MTMYERKTIEKDLPHTKSLGTLSGLLVEQVSEGFKVLTPPRIHIEYIVARGFNVKEDK